MQIVFVSNYINHHQIPLSNELYSLTKGFYTFIQTEPMEEERIKMGWDNTSKNLPYVKLFYEEPDSCRKLIFESECVIFGGTSMEELIVPRLEANRFTLRYSERLYKEGRWKFISPRGLRKKYLDHTRFNKNDLYLLCAGAYVAGDYRLVGAYPHKKLKFGYFPEFVEYSDVHEYRKDNSRLEILWVGRFIDWKHPEMMVDLAHHLSVKKMNAHITMIGTGELIQSIHNRIEPYSEYISIGGTKTPDEVRKSMLRSNILVSTSDRREGWGAVVNEGMNSGCVVIAPKEIGAAPYLIENGKNGYIFTGVNRTYKLIKLIDDLYENQEKCLEIGDNAYNTIACEWNQKVAARRLFDFVTSKNIDECCYEKGPLSKA